MTKYLLILSGLLLAVSCKKKDSEIPASDNVAREVPATNQGLDFSTMTDQELDQFAESSTRKLEEPVEGDMISFFTTEMWQFTGGMSPGKSFDYGRGEWYQFNEDMTYEFGLFSETLQRGKWAIDEANNLITLTPDEVTAKETQWRFTTKTHSLVLSGTAKFGDQSTQFKLARTNGKPSQVGF